MKRRVALFWVWSWVWLWALVALLLSAARTEAAEHGAALYETHCARCHNGATPRAPPKSLLAIMSSGAVLRALESGVMARYAAALSGAERRALVTHLTGRAPAPPGRSLAAPACAQAARAAHTGSGPDVRGWGVDLDNRRHFDDTVTALSAATLADLELKWAFAYPDALRARSQPAVMGDTLFVGSQDGSVFALDKRTGCIRWRFQTVAEVRTGIVIGPRDGPGERVLLYFGDLIGNLYALNAKDGTLVWRDRPDQHPSLTLTAAPALHDGVLYVPLSSLEVTEAADPDYACCTFQGGVAAYAAHSGRQLWKGRTIDKPPSPVGRNAAGTDRLAPSGAPVWNTPSIDAERGLLYVGTGENYSSPANAFSDAIVALRLDTGAIAWHRQMTAGDAWNMGCETAARINCPPEDGPDFDFGAATIIARDGEGRDVLLAGQKSGHVYALDLSRRGALRWRRKLGRGGIQGGVHFGMAVHGQTLYVPMSDFDGGPRWPGIARPGMFAVDITSGETLWYTAHADHCRGRAFCQPGISAAATSIPGAVLGGAMDGVLRAYAADTGEVVWAFDTAREFAATDGGAARGGSMGGASGAVPSGDMLFVNSGYGIYFHMPGAALLAFGPKN